MYVAVVGSGRGSTKKYVLIKESFRNEKGQPRSRTVQNLGPLDALLEKDPQALEKLRAQYQSDRDAKRSTAAAVRTGLVQAQLQAAEESHLPIPLVRYGHFPLRRIWTKDLQLDVKIRNLQAKSAQRFDRNAALSFMTFMKVLDPHSILFSYSSKDSFIGDPAADLSLDNLYSTLDFMQSSKNELFGWINRRLDEQFGKKRATLVFYDVTNTYFEAPMTDAERNYERADFPDLLVEAAKRARDEKRLPSTCFDEEGELIPSELPDSFWNEVTCDEKLRYLRMRGPSKEHRFDLPLVSVALVIDSMGFPMDFAVYAGNASEFTTMKNSIEELKRKYAIEDAVVVADRGLNSTENLKMLRDAKLGYLVAQKVSQLDAETEAAMLDLDSYEYVNPTRPDSTRFKVIPNWKKHGRSGGLSTSLVFTYNEKRRKRDLAILEAWRQVILRKKEAGEKVSPKKFGWASIVKTDGTLESAILGINEALYEKKVRLCGFAGLVYEDAVDYRKRLAAAEAQEQEQAEEKGRKSKKNVTALATEPDEDAKRRLGAFVASTYARLNQIEDAFRVMKSNLGLRPMFVRNSIHVQGHVGICVLALLLVRLLQDKLKKAGVQMSIDEISRSLRTASTAVLRSGDSLCFQHVGEIVNPRRRNPSLSTDELLTLIREEKQKANGIWTIMQACGLKPLPRATNRHELARCLGTRFGSDQEALSPIVLEQL